MMREPTGISTLATTTSLRLLLKVCALSKYCLTETAAIRPNVIAANRAMIKRLFRMMILSPTQNRTFGKQDDRNQASQHDRDAVGNRVFAIGRYLETRHLPTGQNADEDAQHAVQR